jgi:uncharacterized protein
MMSNVAFSKAKNHPLKRIVLAAALALGVSFAAYASVADAPASAPSAPAHAASMYVSLLRKIADKDNTLYLLGSFHMLRSNDLPLSSDIDAAMHDAKTMMFELDMLAMTGPDMLAKMQGYQRIEDSKTMSGLLPVEAKSKLEVYVKGYRVV